MHRVMHMAKHRAICTWLNTELITTGRYIYITLKGL